MVDRYNISLIEMEAVKRMDWRLKGICDLCRNSCDVLYSEDVNLTPGSGMAPYNSINGILPLAFYIHSISA